MTPGDGAAAKSALLARKGYVGICHSDLHIEEMYRMLTNFVLQHFEVDGSVFYQATYACAKGVKRALGASEGKGQAAGKQVEKPKASRTGGGKKKKGSTKKNHASSSSGTSSAKSSESKDSGKST